MAVMVMITMVVVKTVVMMVIVVAAAAFDHLANDCARVRDGWRWRHK